MEHMKNLTENFIKKLEWIKIYLTEKNFLYFFPESLTLIEHDENFGQFLKDLQYIDKIENAEEALSPFYPEGYIKDNLYNMQLLLEEDALKPIPLPAIPENLPLQRIILANTLRCNMACKYCYNQFEFNCPSSTKKDMTVRTFRKLTEFLEKNGQNLPFFELLFIGGEPFMKKDILEEAVKWRRKLQKEGRDVLLIPTTNATLLTDEIIDFCVKYKLYLKLTLDGNEREHNRNRIFPDGTGSYEKILKNLPGFFSRYDNPSKYVTTTIDTTESDLEERIIRFSAMGFNIVELTEIYSTEESFDFDENVLEEKYRENYRKLFNFLYLRIRSRNYIHIIPVYDIIKKIHTTAGSFFPCRAGLDSLSVGPDGTIYPCHHFYGDKRFALASVYDRKNKLNLKPYRIRVDERDHCKNCWARFLCGGPCYHRSLAPAGDAFKCNWKECIRKKALYKEALIFYINLKNTDACSIEWLIQAGNNL